MTGPIGNSQLDIEQINHLLQTVLAGLRVRSSHEDYAYTLDEVAQRTGVAVSTLVKECRADRLDHVHKGDFRGMTPAQVVAMLALYSRGGANLAAALPRDDMAAARAASQSAAGRSSRRKAAA